MKLFIYLFAIRYEKDFPEISVIEVDMYTVDQLWSQLYISKNSSRVIGSFCISCPNLAKIDQSEVRYLKPQNYAVDSRTVQSIDRVGAAAYGDCLSTGLYAIASDRCVVRVSALRASLGQRDYVAHLKCLHEVTRPASNNTLDLVASSNPNLVDRITTHHGISDHNIVIFHCRGYPKPPAKPPRKVYLFDKANVDQLKDATQNFTTEFLLSKPRENSVNSNWNTIADFLSKCLSDHIPSKMSKAKRKLPWISAKTYAR